MSDDPIGVVAYQGGFQKHIDALSRLGRDAIRVRDVESALRAAAFVIPGGESTTIGMLLDRFGVLPVLRQRITVEHVPVFGTCAGAILLAREIEGPPQPHLGCLDVSVHRNAYGSQIESFEAAVAPGRLLDSPFPGVFIRAPIITRVGDEVQILLQHEGKPVLVRAGNILAGTFHPELTDDLRLHSFFLREFVDFRPDA